MKSNFVPALLLSCLLLHPGSITRASEFRGLWVDAFGPGFFNADEVKKLAADCRKYNFNAVFVQMRRRGDAFYFPKASNPDPRTALLDPDFDALGEIIKRCHGETPRIEVHCWLVNYFVWSSTEPPPQPGHIYNRHRNWLTQDSAGETLFGNGCHLDPGHPEASQWLHDVAVDIVKRYDVDGLHWDYLRYPGRDSGYNPAAIRRYNQEFGSQGEPGFNDPEFCAWRRRQVTDFLRWTTADLLQIKPRLVISASVFSNYGDSLNYRFADWVNWCKEGILDVTISMDFTTETSGVFVPRAAFALTNQGCRAVYVGQGAYLNTAQTTLAQLERCRKMGFLGTALYSYRQPTAPEAPEEQKLKSGQKVVMVDNADAETSGVWRRGSFGRPQHKDYSFTSGGAGTNSIRFVPKLPVAGEYDVYEWHVAGGNRATDVPFEISHGGETNVVRVNQQRDGSKWNYLGRFRFAAEPTEGIRVTDAVQDTNQVVIADAVRFVGAQEGEPLPGPTIDKIQMTEPPPEVIQQEAVFQMLKEKYQPSWTDVPRLPWKASPKNGIIKGRVTKSREGSPVYNAVVSLESVPGRTQQTEPHGGFAFFEVAPGTHRLKARAERAGAATVTVDVEAGAVVEANLTLSP